jgi:hypothetical protein
MNDKFISHLTQKNMKNVIEITVLQLLVLISEIRRTDFISLIQHTNPTVLKRVCKANGINPLSISKMTYLSAQVGVSYQAKKGKKTNTPKEDVVVKEASYQYISDNKMLAENKKNPLQKYLVYDVTDITTKPRTKFLMDNKIISKAKISHLFSTAKSYSNPVVWRTVKVENIRKLTVNKMTYKVVG